MAIDNGHHKILMGNLIHLTHSILDLHIKVLSQIMQDPSERYLEAVERVRQYLKVNLEK